MKFYTHPFMCKWKAASCSKAETGKLSSLLWEWLLGSKLTFLGSLFLCPPSLTTVSMEVLPACCNTVRGPECAYLDNPAVLYGFSSY